MTDERHGPDGEAGEVDETIVAPRPRPGEARPDLGAEAEDATIVAARPPKPDAASEVEESGRSGHRSTANPAPPVEEPPAGELPPEVLARMFKSPLDARLRVPEAPTPPPEHTLPRRGISPGIPVLSPVRGLGEANASPGGVLSDRFGPPPASVQPPPPAQREGLRSTARANRRFGAGTIIGFAASILVAGFGLWGVAILAFG